MSRFSLKDNGGAEWPNGHTNFGTSICEVKKVETVFLLIFATLIVLILIFCEVILKGDNDLFVTY